LRSDGGDIAGTIQDTDDHHGIRKGSVINCVGTVKYYAQAGCKLLTRGCGERKIPHRLEGGFDGGDEPGRNFFACFGCDTGPNFSKIFFSGIRKAEG